MIQVNDTVSTGRLFMYRNAHFDQVRHASIAANGACSTKVVPLEAEVVNGECFD